MLDEVANRYLLGLDIVQTNSLEEFMQFHGQKLSHTKFLVVDLSGLIDSDDEIITALNTLKTLHGDMRIIVLADRIDEIRSDHMELLRRICARDIFDLIFDPASDELDHSILIGKTKNEARAALTTKPQIAPQQLEHGIIVSSEASHTTAQHSSSQCPLPTDFNAQPRHQAQLAPHLKPHHKPHSSIQQASHLQPKEIIRANKEFRKFKNYISVGVCGTQRHIGTTHASLQMVRFLKDIGFKVCYVEAHKATPNGGIVSIREHYPKITANERKSMMQYTGLNLFYEGFEMVKLMADKYDFYVFDLGALSKDNIIQFLMRDVRVVVSGSKPWELVHLKYAMSMLSTGNSAHYLLNFAPKTQEISILNRFGASKNEMHFSDYAPDPFKSVVNTKVHRKIFKEYIVQD